MPADRGSRREEECDAVAAQPVADRQSRIGVPALGGPAIAAPARLAARQGRARGCPCSAVRSILVLLSRQ
ncbi:hypothetical protein JD79_02590 [Geodermatophilus normandii]|uniref:Uncharacterized protein n=1 Tax=Geodermatophilus normandii TaxID=1137989 RepID=A0A317QL18_9ACTN|nr:hypothetical protein JD79_02590 [Geodermatophilus normandii]